MLELSGIGLATAFLAGMVSFLSPCVLPLVPGYIAYISGRTSIEDAGGAKGMITRLPAVALSLCFVLGFSTVFVLLGASATAFGQLLLGYRYELGLVSGAIVAIFGLFMIGAIRPAWMLSEARFYSTLPGGGPVSAYILGLAFAFGWTPCIGPILGAILTVGASTGTVSQGIGLLTMYSLGLGLPFVVAAFFTAALLGRLRSFGRLGFWLKVATGTVMIVMGVAMMSGQMSTFAFWLLATFPALSRIG